MLSVVKLKVDGLILFVVNASLFVRRHLSHPDDVFRVVWYALFGRGQLHVVAIDEGEVFMIAREERYVAVGEGQARRVAFEKVGGESFACGVCPSVVGKPSRASVGVAACDAVEATEIVAAHRGAEEPCQGLHDEASPVVWVEQEAEVGAERGVRGDGFEAVAQTAVAHEVALGCGGIVIGGV